jgi:adenosylcobinamide-phosphate synthase
LIYLTATTIALRELIASARLVIESVKDGALDASRKKLAMIVGRDTGNLTEDGVMRATVETLAENLSDGVIAPIFYLTLGGIPLAIAYKAINTLDSMVGYKNERYIRFGWAAARLDDIANFIPARITGMFIVIAAFLYSLFREPANSMSVARKALSVMRRDGRNHTSPNSGIPEAAMAGALGLRLGGPSTYRGVVVEKPYIGDEMGTNSIAASESAVALVSLASFLSVVTAAILLPMRAML